MIDPETYLIRGRSQVHRKPVTSDGGSGGFGQHGALLVGSTFGTSIPATEEWDPDWVVDGDTDGYATLPTLTIPSDALQGIQLLSAHVILTTFGMPSSGYAQVTLITASFPITQYVRWDQFVDASGGYALVAFSMQLPMINGDAFQLRVSNNLDIGIDIPPNQYGAQMGCWLVHDFF